MIYNYKYIKKYETPFGYRWETYILPNWLSIEIIIENESKVIYIHSKIHVNKKVKLNPSYSLDFSNKDILKEVNLKRWE